jgi:hypothetical protein
MATLVLFSCKKAEDRKCWKGVGEEITQERMVDSYDHLFLGPHIEYVLVQDTVEKVILTGGENLLNFISTDVAEGELRITNDNKCNFLRTYKKSVKAEIHLKDLQKIHFEGTKTLTCKNQLNIPYLTVFVRDGAGELNLNVNSISLYTVITHGWGNIKLSGQTSFARMEIKSNGSSDAYSLNVLDSMYVISNTVETVKVNANNILLRSETASAGDIWYIGSPSETEHNQYGTGELIDKN